MVRTSDFLDGVYLILISAFFLFFKLGGGSLASWDEAVYAEVAKQIVHSGDWFRLTWNGNTWVDKPPLAIWATALLFQHFGISEFTARAFSAVCGVGTVGVTFLLGRRLFNQWTGLLGALVLLSSSHFVSRARFGMLDAPLTFFLSLALYFFWLGREKDRYLISSGIAIGLAVMTKSFAAFFVFPIVWLYCWWAGEGKILSRSSYWIGVITAAAIALPWALYEMLINRGPFVQEALVKHFFLWPTHPNDGHSGSYYYYIQTLVNKYHPWVLVGILSGPFFIYKAVKERVNEFVFIAVWMLSILVIITLMQTKLRWYILPLYPALSISVGWTIAKIFGESHKNILKLVFIGALALHVQYSNIFRQDYSRPIKGIKPLIAGKVPATKILYLYNYHRQPEALYYLEVKTAYLDSPDAFLSETRRNKDFYCLILEKDLKTLEERLPARHFSIAASFENLRFITNSAKNNTRL